MLYVVKDHLQLICDLSVSALEYHNLNTSVATREYWVITGNFIPAPGSSSCVAWLLNFPISMRQSNSHFLQECCYSGDYMGKKN